MIYEDLTFTIEREDGREVECNIVSLFPKDEIESYVLFFDDTKDENGNNILKYGKLIKKGDDFELKAGVEPDELEYIKDNFYDEIVELANKIVEGE